MDEQIDGWMDEQIDGWMNEWTDGWMNDGTDKCVIFLSLFYTFGLSYFWQWVKTLLL